ncbi:MULTISPECIES: hypothetical protein [unclassified Methylobacterium]|uniref:hypothetical protein n=1 Tax=unclassified Methylobacterium TaxID=2615210 RepID=UPI0006FF3EF3|nr:MULTISPECIES: hypothetical protein [unclassified Methylobacterium]KQO58258.1 hypothetical protein ASF24_16765 [Methylobacterium sp. Leaf86]KQO93701.1 hypothetical protein ASF32_20135 [Methylobacterium sp. Leaf91]MBO1020527.1 hypothetical protein [Methylobacterium sp. SD274]
MTRTLIRAALASALILGLTDAALARGGTGGGGDGLSPYSALSGNDRSAGVNNGNYRDPRLDPYLQTYGRRYVAPRPYGGAGEYGYRPSRRGYDGYGY